MVRKPKLAIVMIFKTFKIRERHNFEFRAEFFDLDAAKQKIKQGQEALIEELETIVNSG